MGARKTIIEKLKEEDEVSNICVSKMETNNDVNNMRWNKVDIFLKSKKELKFWKEIFFKKKIYSKATCGKYLKILSGK